MLLPSEYRTPKFILASFGLHAHDTPHVLPLALLQRSKLTAAQHTLFNKEVFSLLSKCATELPFIPVQVLCYADFPSMCVLCVRPILKAGPRLQVTGDKITFALDGHTALQLVLATADEANTSSNAEMDASLPAIIYQYVRFTW